MGGNHGPDGRNRIIKRGAVIYGADEEIAGWVGKKIPDYTLMPGARSLGVIKDDRIVAGVVFERCNGHHVEASIAALPGSDWADRRTLFQLFAYPFLQLEVQAVTVLVSMANLESLNLATKLGFAPVAFVPFAARDGAPLIILQMTIEQCRWLKHGQGQQGTGGARSV
jgi:hypothetical protein